MTRDEILKLLGGYATGTLTPEEQQALFAAALDDQELFDALGREQVLRDLLRDPAAKANLLAALDAPAPSPGGFWAWLRRPMIPGLVAAAGVAGIAIFGIWQAMHPRPVAWITVTELKREKAVEVPAAVPAPSAIQASAPARLAEQAPVEPARQKAVARDEIAMEKRKDASADAFKDAMKEVAPVVNLPAPASAPASPPVPQAVAVTATGAMAAPPANAVGTIAGAEQITTRALNQVLADTAGKDARTLFFGNAFVPREGDAATQLGASASAPKAESPRMRMASGAGGAAKKEAVPLEILGVRVSLLRSAEEAALGTVLNAGEAVRLRITPNADGFLYVAARQDNTWKMLTSGPVARLKALETPTLSFAGAGERQVYVMLSRQPQTVLPQALPGMVRMNLVETTAALDRATYVVANEGPLVQMITLTYK